MTTFDFRASQFRGAKFISSGSTGTGAKLVFYDISADSTSNPNNGVIDPVKFNTSSIGTDIFLFISGGIGQRGTGGAQSVSVFGGDLVISGALYAASTSYFGTPLTSNLIPQDTIAYFSGTVNKVLSGPNQKSTVFNTDVVFSGSILLRTSSLNPISFIIGPSAPSGIVFSGSQIDLAAPSGFSIGNFVGGVLTSIPQTDVIFFSSGAINGKNGSTRAIALFGGDVHISGNLTIDGTNNPSIRTTALSTFAVSASDFGNGIGATFSGSVTASFTNALTASFPSGKFPIIVIQFESTGALPLISGSGGVTFNGSAAAFAPFTGAGVISLTTRDGLSWFK